MPSPRRRHPPEPQDAWSRRDVGLHLLATLASSLIHFSQGVAVGWHIYEHTGSAFSLGLVGLFQFLPILGLFLITGHLVDRYERRAILLVSLPLTAASSAWLAATMALALPVGWIYGALFLSGCAQILNRPARDALLPSLVPATALARTLAINTSLVQTASVSAPAAAGLILALDHSAVPVPLINVGLAFIALGATLAIRTRSRAAQPGGFSLHSLLGGLRFVWQERPVLAVMTVDMLAVLFGGAVALLPVYAKDILNVGPGGLGVLSAAPAVGAVLVSLGIARFGIRVEGRLFLWTVAGFGLATMVFGYSRSFPLSLLALLAIGAFDSVSVVIRQTIVQGQTPDALRGRVAAVNRVFISSSNELGAVESGTAAALLGPVAAVVAGGAATLLVVAGCPLVFPQLKHLGRPPSR